MTILAAVLLVAGPQGPDLRHLFLLNIATLLAVAAFASAAILILLRRSYSRRLEEEKLATMGTVTARILHQLKNPLQSLILQAELLQEFDRAESAELRREAANSIAIEAHRLATMLNELSVWASGARRSLQLEPTPVHDLIADFARRVGYESEKVGVGFETRIAAQATAAVDAYFLQQALENLTRNAQDALRGQPDGKLVLELDRAPATAVIRIIDNGPGIAADRLETIFQPFVSGKSSGMGLGLAISREIVEGHGGELSVKSAPSSGTIFTVSIPLAQDDGRTGA